MCVYVCTRGLGEIITCARTKPNPMDIQRMLYDNFYDFKPVANDILSKIPWRKICWIRYEKNSPNILYKTILDYSDFVQSSLKRKKW